MDKTLAARSSTTANPLVCLRNYLPFFLLSSETMTVNPVPQLKKQDSDDEDFVPDLLPCQPTDDDSLPDLVLQPRPTASIANLCKWWQLPWMSDVYRWCLEDNDLHAEQESRTKKRKLHKTNKQGTACRFGAP